MLNTNVQNMQSKWVHSVGLGLDLDLASTFSFQRFPLFLFFIHAFQGDKFTVHALQQHYSCTVAALFMRPIATLFKKYIKNGSHGTIHIFKNYFTIVFSVFNFRKNKFNPDGWFNFCICRSNFFIVNPFCLFFFILFDLQMYMSVHC